MKKLLFIVVVATIVFACNSKSGNKEENQDSLKSKQEASIAAENLQTIEFKVEGMSCAGCENAIKGSVEKCPGVKEVTASATEGNTVVIFDKTKTGADSLKKAITGKGYEVTGYRVK